MCGRCAHSLKAFLGAAKQECPDGRPRDHVGDTTFQVSAPTARLCAERMRGHLDLLHSASRRDDMVLNDDKSPVLGLTKEVRHA